MSGALRHRRQRLWFLQYQSLPKGAPFVDSGSPGGSGGLAGALTSFNTNELYTSFTLGRPLMNFSANKPYASS